MNRKIIGNTVGTTMNPEKIQVPAPDMSDFVKNTDYPTNSKSGVIKVQSNTGFNVGTDGALRPTEASNIGIDNRATKYGAGFGLITPANLDYAVKSGLTTNTLEWTDEEKASALKLLGGVPNIKETTRGTLIEITDGAEAPLVGLRVYGNESEPTNLLLFPYDYMYIKNEMLGGSETGTYNGLDITMNGDGSITVNGTTTEMVDLFLIHSFSNLVNWEENPEGQSWTLVYDIGLSDESARNKITFYSRNAIELKKPYTLTFEEMMMQGENDEISILLNAGETFNNLTIYPQINKDCLKSWSPCGMPIFTNKPITVSMSNGTETKDVIIPLDALYGYKETNMEEQDVRDYIDFERKKLVKYYNYEYVLSSMDSMVEGGIFNTGFDYRDAESKGVNTKNCVLKNDIKFKRASTVDDVFGHANPQLYFNCWMDMYLWVSDDRWQYMTTEEVNAELSANPLVFVFPTLEPIEYDLTYEQISAFEKMLTFYGKTTISNDCGAIMEVTSVKDMKLYIDKKIEELKN